MNPLDDIQHILTLDRSEMYKAIKDLPLQLTQTWEETNGMELPYKYDDILNVIVVGMGSSTLGAYTILGLFRRQILKPIEIVNSYHLPGYAGEKTLIIVISDSGNTEETISCLNEAVDKKCKVIGISAGGRIKEILEDQNYPMYVFDERYNMTGQSRMSPGYLLLSILAFLHTLEFLEVDGSDVINAIESMGSYNTTYGIEIPANENGPKQIAQQLHFKVPFIIGADFLSGVARSFSYQINDNAKSLSAYFLISEMNHHLLEGLGYEQNKDEIVFVMAQSDLYPIRIQQRFKLCDTIIEKNNFKVIRLQVPGSTSLSQAFNLLQFGTYVSYYMAILNNIDPSPIPWVNFIKKELSEMHGD